MDMQTISDIYLNHIDKWNHKNITALNPHLNLPDKPIILAIQVNSSAATSLLTKMLGVVPEFRAVIEQSNLVTYPVQSTNRWVPVYGNAVVDQLTNTSYSMGWWLAFEIDTRCQQTLRSFTKLN